MLELQALDIYRTTFKPSLRQQKPHAMAVVNIIAADTDAESQHLFTSLQMRFADMARGSRGYMQPPSTIPRHTGPAPRKPKPNACWHAHLSARQKYCGEN